jgi:hypothetical protein
LEGDLEEFEFARGVDFSSGVDGFACFFADLARALFEDYVRPGLAED